MFDTRTSTGLHVDNPKLPVQGGLGGRTLTPGEHSEPADTTELSGHSKMQAPLVMIVVFLNRPQSMLHEVLIAAVLFQGTPIIKTRIPRIQQCCALLVIRQLPRPK